MTLPFSAVVSRRATSRGPLVETLHRVHIAITDPEGRLVASAGDPRWATPLRSCLKPFQAQAMWRSGAVDRFQVDPEELALACASHDGAPAHTERVSAWLLRMGFTPRDLLCGAHLPSDPDGLSTLAGAPPTAVHNNCSGKHAGFLAASLALEADPRRYLDARHPVQRLVRDAIRDHLGLDDDLPWGVDGCSAPTPVTPLTALARAFARLIAATRGQLADPDLARTGQAMIDHAELVGGRGVLDTRLMRTLRDLCAKRGADGVYALGLIHPTHGPLGVALKVEDGSSEARTPAVLAVLEALDRLVPAAIFALHDTLRPDRLNHRGLVVGTLEPAITLTWH
jgi:L-asparaginase II